MLEFQEWKIQYWPGGWVRALDEGTGAVIVLRYLPVAHKGDPILRLHSTLMISPQPITARQWREAPLGKIEQTFARWSPTRLKEFLRPHPHGLEPFSPDQVAKFFENTPPLDIDHQLTVGHRVSDDDQPEKVFAGLRRPADRRISDEFLHEVAIVYRWLVSQGEEAPANVIGKQVDAPARTVHRWIADARKRNLLPPAVKGKAG